MTTKFIPISTIMDRLLRNPLLKDLQYESVIDYTIDFIEIVGLPELKTQDNLFIGKLKNYKVQLPCELTEESFVLINSIPAHYSSDTMLTNLNTLVDKNNYQKNVEARMKNLFNEQVYTYKLSGRYLFANVETGQVVVQFDALKVDDIGEPMIPDDRLFMKALELYIKYQYQTIKFEEGKLHPSILQNTDQEYSWAVAQLESRNKMPSYSEMATIMNALTTLRSNHNAFDNRFGVLNSKVINKNI